MGIRRFTQINADLKTAFFNLRESAPICGQLSLAAAMPRWAIRAIRGSSGIGLGRRRQPRRRPPLPGPIQELPGAGEQTLLTYTESLELDNIMFLQSYK
jgi:hypothetical protein